MITCIRSFVIAAILLNVCNLAGEAPCINATDQTSVAWAEAAAGEEDTTEGEDDDMTGDLVHVAMGEPNGSMMTGLELLNFNEHVREVVLPPPLA